jgi:RNA polymerase sigma-70 factor (ECF subfamily)
MNACTVDLNHDVLKKEVDIQACRMGSRDAQKHFYDHFAPMVLGVCRRYLSNTMEAEDAMIRTLYKALTSLDSLRDASQLKAWLRRIATNECLMDIRKHKQVFWEDLDAVPELTNNQPTILDKLMENDLLKLLHHLPEGYRTIFNLYVLDGFNHREIGELLGISLHTSKSQLLHARKKLAGMLKQPNKIEDEFQ